MQVRVGYLMNYCEDDMVTFYLFGSIPTGKKFDNSVWMQPLVGTRNGGIGAGLMFDLTLWESDLDGSDCLLMTELKYLHRFKNCQRRMFDLRNGNLSRFLLMVTKDRLEFPEERLDLLTKCVTVEPRSTIEWWIALHYEYCSWGFEAGYNLWWRQKECIKTKGFDFKGHGIFDMTRCENLTTHNKARISDAFGVGTPDPEFTELTSDRVKLRSGAARKTLSHTLSGIVTYNDTWCETPFSLAFGARYEFSGTKRHTSTFENWGVFGKISYSC